MDLGLCVLFEKPLLLLTAFLCSGPARGSSPGHFDPIGQTLEFTVETKTPGEKAKPG